MFYAIDDAAFDADELRASRRYAALSPPPRRGDASAADDDAATPDFATPLEFHLLMPPPLFRRHALLRHAAYAIRLPAMSLQR